MNYFTLNDGSTVPCICFGPGMLTRGLKSTSNIIGRINYKISYIKKQREFYDAVLSAIKVGYRFIDYSIAYGREDLIKKAIKNSGVNRNEFILTTRITNMTQMRGDIRESFYRSLERFGTDYLDLLMFHWPVTDKFINTYEEMIRLKEEGLCKSIGVSNCHSHHLNAIIQKTGVTPVINQIEIHPLFTQKGMIKYCNEHGIRLEAYTPLARMDERIVRLPKMKELSLKYNKSITQLVLRWHIQNGIIPVFRSFNYQRQKENMDIFDFNISDEDMNIIDSVNINSRLRYDPDNCDFNIL